MKFEELLEELALKKEKARQQGGPEKVKRHHERGSLTARERVAKILDDGSFLELGLLATSDRPGMEEKTPADGIVLGFGTINNRRVGVVANDFTVLASTNARINLKKGIQFKTLVNKNNVPLIWFGEAGGARMPDVQGSRGICSISGGGTDTLRVEYGHIRIHPFVMAAMGECYGIPDFQACLADFVVQVKGSAISISGPRALSKAIGQSFSGEELGGWEVHDKITGMADRIAEDEEECFAIIKEFLDYLPSNNTELPPVRPVPEGSGEKMPDILEFLPEKRTRTYDMHKILECIVDGGKLFELKPNFGKMLITSLCRVNGETIGIIASNPAHNMGAMNTDGLEKLTSFLCLCDSFNIPLVFFHDTPGHWVGKEAEEKRVGAKVMNALQALYQVTVPKIAIVIRKSYGQAAANMCGPGSGPDYFVAWPTAEIGFMDPTIAADVVFGKLSEEERTKMTEVMVSDCSPYPVAQEFYVQDIIDPRETRKYLVDVLKIIRDSADKGMGQHLLAGWPNKF